MHISYGRGRHIDHLTSSLLFSPCRSPEPGALGFPATTWDLWATSSDPDDISHPTTHFHTKWSTGKASAYVIGGQAGASVGERISRGQSTPCGTAWALTSNEPRWTRICSTSTPPRTAASRGNSTRAKPLFPASFQSWEGELTSLFHSADTAKSDTSG